MSIEYRTIHHIGGKVERIKVRERQDPITFKIEAWRMANIVVSDTNTFMALLTSRASIYGVPTKLVDGRWHISHGAVDCKLDDSFNVWVTWIP